MNTQKLKTIAVLFGISTMTFINSKAYSETLGSDSGGGGWIQEIREAEILNHKSLTEEDIKKFLIANGKDLKENFLIPFYSEFIEETDLKDNNLESIQSIMKENKDNIFDDIKYSKISLGVCPNNENMCTGTLQYSDVVINLNSMLSTKYGVTFSEFVGLVIHEFTHHYAADIDHPYYKLARFATDKVLNDQIGKKTFLFKELLYKELTENNYYGLAKLSQDDNYIDDKIARKFCVSKGYQKSSYFKKSSFSIDELYKYHLFQIVKGTYWKKDKYYISIYNLSISPVGDFEYNLEWKLINDSITSWDKKVIDLFINITCQK